MPGKDHDWFGQMETNIWDRMCLLSMMNDPKKSSTTLVVVHFCVGFVILGIYFLIISYIWMIYKNKHNNYNSLKKCLNNRQTTEARQNKQKNNETAMLSAELSTVLVDRFFLVCHSIMCRPQKNRINITYVR